MTGRLAGVIVNIIMHKLYPFLFVFSQYFLVLNHETFTHWQKNGMEWNLYFVNGIYTFYSNYDEKRKTSACLIYRSNDSHI